MIKNLIRKWLGLPPIPSWACNDPPAPIPPSVSLIESPAPKTTVQVIDATNGKVVVVARYAYNPNGPDKHSHDVYIVPEGQDVGAAVIGAMTAAKLL